MTERSTRRTAEMAVIDEANRLVDKLGWQGYPFEALSRAVYAHRQLGLDTTSQPAFSHNSTDTSAEAGASMNQHVAGIARQCFDEITSVYRSDGVGLTVDQLEQLMNSRHQTVSARVNELRNKGWVRDSGVKRPTRSGRSAIVWMPTVQALTT